MFVVHFRENNSTVLTQFRDQLPTLDENIKIKGRKGKVSNVKNVEDHIYHVLVTFESVNKKKTTIVKDDKKKR